MTNPVFQYIPSSTLWEKGEDLVFQSGSKFGGSPVSMSYRKEELF